MSIYSEQIRMGFDEAVAKGFNSFGVDIPGTLDSADFLLIASLGLSYDVLTVSTKRVGNLSEDSEGSCDRYIFSVQQSRKPEHIKIMNVLRANFERYHSTKSDLHNVNVYYFMVNPSGVAVLIPAMHALVPGAIYVTAKKTQKHARSGEELALLMDVLATLPVASFSEWEAIFRSIGWL